MTAVSAPTSADSILQYVNKENLTKIESFLNDSAYREAIENSSTYNSRLCRERRLRMPFLDSQTGVAQNHSALFMSSRERLPGLQHGQIYTYPSKRWRKKRRQYLMNYFHPKRVIRGDIEDGLDCIESTVPGANDDSKDSLALKDEHSKDAWFYDEADMLDMDQYDEPDPDSDFDYEESYSSKRKRRKGRGGGHHPARSSHPPTVESPAGKRSKGGGRGRKKVNYDASDTDKPFVCDLCGARYKTRPGLVYHYGHSHSTSSGDPAKELSPSPADVESRSVADAVASDQPGGSRRGRQGSGSVTTAASSSSPSAAVAGSSSIPAGSGGGGGISGLGGSAAASAGAAPVGQPVNGTGPNQLQQPQLLSAESSCATAPASPTVSAIAKDEQHQQHPPLHPHHLPHGGPPGGPPMGGGPMMPSQQNNIAPGMVDPSGMANSGGPGISQHHQGNHHHAGGMDGKKGKPVHPSPYCDFCLGDASQNKKTERSEELVSCSDCGRSGKQQTNNHHQQQSQQPPEQPERTKRKYTRRANNHN